MDILKAVHSAKTYDEFLTRLKDHEVNTATKYVLASGNKSFVSQNVKLSQDLRLHWQHDVPYFHFGTRTYLCHRGKDTNLYQKERYARERERKASEGHDVKRYNRTQLTKKLNCPAAVYVTRVIRMPEFKIFKEITRSRKDQMSLRIKKKISESAEIGEECYLFNLPDIDDHKFHSQDSAAEATKQKVAVKRIGRIKRRKTKKEQVTEILQALNSVSVGEDRCDIFGKYINRIKRQKTKKGQPAEALQIAKPVSESEDRCDILGKYIASEMRHITDETIFFETKLALESIVNDSKRRMLMQNEFNNGY